MANGQLGAGYLAGRRRDEAASALGWSVPALCGLGLSAVLLTVGLDLLPAGAADRPAAKGPAAQPQPPRRDAQEADPHWRERAVLRWEDHHVKGAAFDRDGKRLVVVGTHGSLKTGFAWTSVDVWEPAAGKPSRKWFVRHWLADGPLALAPDGRTVALPGRDGSPAQPLKLFDVTTGKELAVLEPEDTVTSLAFTPDGKALVAGLWTMKDNLRVWAVPTGRALDTLTQPGYVSAVAVMPRGNRLVSGSLGAVAVRGPLPSLKERPGLVGLKTLFASALAVSPDGKTLAVASPMVKELLTGAVVTPPMVRLVELATGGVRATLETTEKGLRCAGVLAFSPDGRTLAWVQENVETHPSAGLVALWDVATRRQTATLVHPEGQCDVLFSPDGRTLATVGQFVRLWELTR